MRELVAIDVTKLVALSAEYEHQMTTGGYDEKDSLLQFGDVRYASCRSA